MRNFGLIGNPLSHSFSKKYFTNKFKKESILDANYELFPIKEIDEIKLLLQEQKDLLGLNVTIPYKQAVIPYLDELDPTAKAVGAVNTIKISTLENVQVQLKGYNTDVIGFRQSLKPFLAKEHERALIFGSGGASKAVSYVLDQLNIPHFIVSRNPTGVKAISYSELDEASVSRFQLLINCTPLGMSPNLDQMPPIPMDAVGKKHLAYDLVYNPLETKFLAMAKAKGALTVNGLSMLQLQAEAAWKIWNEEK